MQVRDMVEKILQSNPHTRNSDTDLYCELINQFLACGISKAQVEIMKKIPFESVTRVRRELCKKEEYKADQEIQDMREEKCRQITTQYGGWRQYCESLLNKFRQKEISLPF